MSVSISSHSLRQWVSLLGGCSYSGVASHLMCKPANSLHSAAHSSSSTSVKALAAIVCGHTDICHCFDGHDVSWWWRLCESQQCFAFFWLIWFSFQFFVFFYSCVPTSGIVRLFLSQFCSPNYVLMVVSLCFCCQCKFGHLIFFGGPHETQLNPSWLTKETFKLTRSKLIFLVDYCGQT